MNGRILQGWFRRVRTWRCSSQSLPSLSKKRINEANHLAGNSPDDFEFSFVRASPFIISALDRDQTFRDFCPFAIHANSISDNKKHHLFERTCPALCETVPIERHT